MELPRGPDIDRGNDRPANLPEGDSTSFASHPAASSLSRLRSSAKSFQLDVLLLKLLAISASLCDELWPMVRSNVPELPSVPHIGQRCDNPGAGSAAFHSHQQAFACVFVDQVEEPHAASTLCPCAHEIVAPHMVPMVGHSRTHEPSLSHSQPRGLCFRGNGAAMFVGGTDALENSFGRSVYGSDGRGVADLLVRGHGARFPDLLRDVRGEPAPRGNLGSCTWRAVVFTTSQLRRGRRWQASF
jgi:hypothetical protein